MLDLSAADSHCLLKLMTRFENISFQLIQINFHPFLGSVLESKFQLSTIINSHREDSYTTLATTALCI